MNILAFDISGNYEEGKGTTGVTEWEDGKPNYLGEIKATDFDRFDEYWQEHLEWIESFNEKSPTNTVIVMEGFRLYEHKAKTQIHSQFETPQLIGLIRWFCAQRGIKLYIQSAATAKTRWSDELLVKLGMLEERGRNLLFNGHVTNRHMRDSLRHAAHYHRYGGKV